MNEVVAMRRIVDLALEEDLAFGPDVTTEATVPGDAIATASITPREDGVLAGVSAVAATIEALSSRDSAGRSVEVEFLSELPDGSELIAGKPAVVMRGPVRLLLTAERTMLNLLCHLSGVATTTAAWVAEVSGTGCAIRDTRKTLPGLRLLEKAAVRAGGGVNHRMALGDAILIKDNHVAAAGSVAGALSAVRKKSTAEGRALPCQVEVDSLEQLDEALSAGADFVLLDNFAVAECAEAVRMARGGGSRDHGSAVKLEASGGLTFEVARAYAETGVDFLAVGALTHSARALDLGLDLS